MHAFESSGGKFITSPEEIQAKSKKIKGFIFDWDGVFNDGIKSEHSPSMFSEPDAAGLNMLRFCYYKLSGKIPFCAIVSGENNPGALYFAMREKINVVYMNTPDKSLALEHITKQFKVRPENLTVVFDDINDISMVKPCGLKFQVKRTSSASLLAFTVKNNLCDYVTGVESGRYPIREICELLMTLTGKYSDCVNSRIDLDDTYQKYLSKQKSH